MGITQIEVETLVGGSSPDLRNADIKPDVVRRPGNHLKVQECPIRANGAQIPPGLRRKGSGEPGIRQPDPERKIIQVIGDRPGVDADMLAIRPGIVPPIGSLQEASRGEQAEKIANAERLS